MTAQEAEEAMAALAEALQAASSRLDALDALILATVALDLAFDSRTLAKAFGAGHALVLRAIMAMSAEPALLAVTQRDARTQRCFLALTSAGEALVAAARPDAVQQPGL